jgi:hypothetical protein
VEKNHPLNKCLWDKQPHTKERYTLCKNITSKSKHLNERDKTIKLLEERIRVYLIALDLPKDS